MTFKKEESESGGINNKRNMLIILLLVALFSINEQALAGDDWEYRSSYEVAGSINENLEFKVRPEVRYKDDFSKHYYTHFDLGLDWKVNDWFILSPYYRHVNEKKKDNWKVEYRPHLSGTFKWKLFGLSFDSRNRLEYRIKEDKGFFRYRNRLRIKLPKFTKFKLQPYIAKEFFYDFDAKELNKNRVCVGADFKIVKNLKGGIHYILEGRKKKGDWTDVNILKTSLKYSF